MYSDILDITDLIKIKWKGRKHFCSVPSIKYSILFCIFIFIEIINRNKLKSRPLLIFHWILIENRGLSPLNQSKNNNQTARDFKMRGENLLILCNQHTKTRKKHLKLNSFFFQVFVSYTFYIPSLDRSFCCCCFFFMYACAWRLKSFSLSNKVFAICHVSLSKRFRYSTLRNK